MEPTIPSNQTNTSNNLPTDTPPSSSATSQTVPSVMQSTAAPALTPSPVMSTPSSPSTSGGVVVDGVAQVGNSPSSGTGQKKWLVPALIAAAVTLLLGGAYVFGLYLPNQPESVFSKSLERSGEAADKLVAYMQDTKDMKGAALSGTMSAKSSDVSMEATMEGEADAKNLSLTTNANVAGQKFTVDFKALDASQSENPDMYVKLSGAKELLSQMGGAQLSSLDGQWVAIDHTLLDTYEQQLESVAGTNVSGTPSAEQLNDAVAKVQAVNKDFLFTSNKAKSVLTYDSFIGKETKAGHQVNHYKASYDKAHLGSYVEALEKALDESKLNDWAKGQSEGKSISKTIRLDELKKAVDKSKGNEVFDVYVDTDNKLVQSIVFTDTKEKTTYTIAQNYTGGDTYPFEFAIDSKGSQAGKLTFDLSVNTKTDELGVKINVDITGMTLALNMTVTPTDKAVTVTAPTGAKPVTDIMKQLGVGQDDVLGAQTLIPGISRSSIQ